MAEHLEPQLDELNAAVETESDDALRKRLLSRVAVAGVAIVGLLGGLAVYDSLHKPQAPAIPKMAALPAEEPPKAEEKPAEAAEQKAPEKAEAEKSAAAEAVPERSETPLAPPPAEKPLKAAKTVTPPAAARQATVKPAEAAAPIKPDAQREIARVMPEASRPAQTARAPSHAPASRPLSQAGETVRRFLVQVGVFGNHANAEELVTKLQAVGIPARIESHVQVGPFASRAEVDAARAKLKSLGLDDGLLVRR
jgi:DedD protein